MHQNDEKLQSINKLMHSFNNKNDWYLEWKKKSVFHEESGNFSTSN